MRNEPARLLPAVMTLAAALLLIPVTVPAADVFEDAVAVRCSVTVAIYDDDAQEAHTRALAAAFSQAVSSKPGLSQDGRAVRPENLVTAYRIVEQRRRDLEYSLTVLVWTTLPKVDPR